MPSTKDLENYWPLIPPTPYLKIPHKRKRYKFREAVSWGGHSGSKG